MHVEEINTYIFVGCVLIIFYHRQPAVFSSAWWVSKGSKGEALKNVNQRWCGWIINFSLHFTPCCTSNRADTVRIEFANCRWLQRIVDDRWWYMLMKPTIKLTAGCTVSAAVADKRCLLLTLYHWWSPQCFWHLRTYSNGEENIAHSPYTYNASLPANYSNGEENIAHSPLSLCYNNNKNPKTLNPKTLKP